MRCDVCGTTTVPASTGGAVRCTNCGNPINATAGAASPTKTSAVSNFSYATPHGRLNAEVQSNGKWRVAVTLTPAANKSDAAATEVEKLVSSWAKLDDKRLPKLHSFDRKTLCCTWDLPGSAGLVPLKTRQPRLDPTEVKKLVIALAEPLSRLHRLGLGAYDLSPSVIFHAPGIGQAILIPTPWLAALAQWAPSKDGELPFVAPELLDPAQKASPELAATPAQMIWINRDPLASPQVLPEPAAADVFALGALAWFLLTGKPRTRATAQLPSEVDPALAPWDTFIDGCCRSIPSRRFASINLAIKSLLTVPQAQPVPPNPPVDVTTPSTDPVIPSLFPQEEAPVSDGLLVKFRKRRALLLGVPAVIAIGGLVYFRDSLFKNVPGSIGGYRRGYGDTVLKYADRSYDNKWAHLKGSDTDSYGNGRLRNVVEYKQVAGWDADNFWVIASGYMKTMIVPYSDGHWRTPEELSSTPDPIARLLDEKSLLVASGTRSDSVFKVTTNGTIALAEDEGVKKKGANRGPGTRHSGYKSIFTINSDLYYLTCRDHNNIVVKVADGVWSDLRPDKLNEEAFLHNEDKDTVKEQFVSHVTQTHTYSPGKAIGMYIDTFGNPAKVVEYREGFWCIVESLKDLNPKKCHATWLISDGTKPSSLMIVGEGGYVYRKDFPESGITLPTVPMQKSSRNLILVWGVSRDKFWVMDNNGTIWEWNSKEWRQIVNGMYENDVEFVNAWVSPSGTVIAVTKSQIYRLD